MLIIYVLLKCFCYCNCISASFRQKQFCMLLLADLDIIIVVIGCLFCFGSLHFIVNFVNIINVAVCLYI